MYYTIINAEDVKKEFVIVDCRFRLNDVEFGKREYLKNHIEGAFYAHLDDDLSDPVIPGITGRHPLPSIEKLDKLFGSFGIKKGDQVVVYDDMGGAIASRLWWLLKWVGHSEVAVLNGGFQAWLEIGGNVSDEIPKPEVPTNFQSRPDFSMLVEVQQFEKNYADQICLVDCRAEERYLGINEPIDPVAGHIPGAFNLPHHLNLDSNGRWKSPSEVKAIFQKLNNNKVVGEHAFYCGSGVTACFNILAMEYAGLGRGKLYAGSWSHWITDERRPIAN